MALVMSWEEGGFGCPEAYVRICGVDVVVGNKTATVQTWTYQSQEARDAGKPVLFAHSYSAVGDDFEELFSVAALDGPVNPILQGYVWLKRPHPVPEDAPPGGGMPDFSGAIDV
jgi:hypothetical protein